MITRFNFPFSVQVLGTGIQLMVQHNNEVDESVKAYTYRLLDDWHAGDLELVVKSRPD